jgi:hypothetical protein
LDELLCRLADNYWIGGVHGDGTKKYDTPLDISFYRDIDPTILPRPDGSNNTQGTREPPWLLGPDIVVTAIAEDDLARWPFEVDPAQVLPDLIYRVDREGFRWLTLYDYESVTVRYDNDTNMEHGSRQQEFRFVFCVLVRRADEKPLIEHLRIKHKIDGSYWDPPEFTDGPYLLEAPWRTTWPQCQWRDDGWTTPKGVAIAFPVSEYAWESHLDASLPRGSRAFVLSPWLTAQLGLSPDRTDASIYRDASGRCRFIGSKLEPNASSALVDAEFFQAYLDQHSLDCVWLFIAERNAWPGGNNDNAAWRRSEGFCWTKRGKLIAETWCEDRANGASRIHLSSK